MPTKRFQKPQAFPQTVTLASILGISIVLALSVLLPHSLSAAGYEAQIDLYEPTLESVPIQLAPTDVFAFRFKTDMPFCKLTLPSPSYNDNIGDLRFTLYAWNESLEKTLSGEAIVSETFVDFPDNMPLSLSPSTLPAGEYLLKVDGARQIVGVWTKPETREGMACWKNGEPVNATLCLQLTSNDSPIPFLGSKRWLERALRPATCPAEAEQKPLPFDVQPDLFAATDELGRVLPDASAVGAPRSEKQVGIFYWTWHHCRPNQPVYNNAQILRDFPETKEDRGNPAWGPVHLVHHWDEPLLGFYDSNDRWVLRHHAQWLANAQIDFVLLDCTNGVQIWESMTHALFQTFSEARQDGVNAPKIALMLPFNHRPWLPGAIRLAYRSIYRDGKYQDCWLRKDGKPVLCVWPEIVDEMIEKTEGDEKAEWETIRSFFTFRPVQPDYKLGPIRPDYWTWLEVYPQHGFCPHDGKFEMVSVGVAQNYSEHKLDGGSGLCAMNDRDVFGRAHVVGKPKDTRENAHFYGGNFQQQWERAFELDPDMVFVTGWNEWTVGYTPKWQGLDHAFPDQYSPEFSRDTEPSAGELRDHYYNLLVSNVRRFKGVRKAPKASAPKTIPWEDREANADPWADVEPTFYDYQNDTTSRDAIGAGQFRYTNTTGRNDIVRAKVARDSEFVYFMVETQAPLTSKDDPNWMQLFFSLEPASATATSSTEHEATPAANDAKAQPNWQGFQFIVNRTAPGEKALLERSTGGWNWASVGEIDYRVQANRLELRIPRALLGLAPNDEVKLQFKWADNAFRPDSTDLLDFYQYGDAAPDGRFRYVFQ